MTKKYNRVKIKQTSPTFKLEFCPKRALKRNQILRLVTWRSLKARILPKIITKQPSYLLLKPWKLTRMKKIWGIWTISNKSMEAWRSIRCPISIHNLKPNLFRWPHQWHNLQTLTSKIFWRQATIWALRKFPSLGTQWWPIISSTHRKGSRIIKYPNSWSKKTNSQILDFWAYFYNLWSRSKNWSIKARHFQTGYRRQGRILWTQNWKTQLKWLTKCRVFPAILSPWTL